MTNEGSHTLVKLLLRPTETCNFQHSAAVFCTGDTGKQESVLLAIVSNTQAGVEESCVFIIKQTGQMSSVLQSVLPIYFDFRISVAQTKAVDVEDKSSIQNSKNDFTLKLFCDQIEVIVHTDDLMTLQGLLQELRRSHLIAQDDNFYAGGSSHRWVPFYTVPEDAKEPASKDHVATPDEFIASSENPLALYFLQPEEDQTNDITTPGTRLSLGVVKEAWIEKEMRSRESAFTEHQFMTAFVGTWNVNGRNASQKLDSWLKTENGVDPDIYVLCFQELDLSAEAYIVLDGSKEEEWTRAISESLGIGYQKVMSKQLIGLLIVMFAANDHADYIKDVSASSAGCGIMGMLGNKGGVSIRIRYKDSHLCFVGSHLAADTTQVDRRNQDYVEICRRLSFPSSTHYDITKSPASNANLPTTNKMASIFDSDHTIWAGDLNYRIALPLNQVKSLAEANDYEGLLKHDQLYQQQGLRKAFSEFKEGPITFQPTYKYDVGGDVWDSSEKKRVPSYTDRILWHSKDTSDDAVQQVFYKSQMDLTLSDHKPVSSLFKLKVKTLLHDKQAEVYQSIVRELDKYENECMPDATISSSTIDFAEVRYLEPKKSFITIQNTGKFPAQYRFKPKLQDVRFCMPWIWANPPVGLIMPGERSRIYLTVMVDNASAPLLNTAKEKLEDILILHLEHGKDYFVSVSGSYIRTCFGNSLEWLSRLDRPIRLWNADEEDTDNDEDDVSTLLDSFSILGSKSSMSSMKEKGTAQQEKDAAKQVKSAKSLDSLSEKDQKRLSLTEKDRGRQASMGTLKSHPGKDEEKKGASGTIRKHKPTRQLSLPKDLWRIVDFIYKYGFSVDNLFLLSGDQSTMTYIRECLDTGEEFDLDRLLDKNGGESSTGEDHALLGGNSHKGDGGEPKKEKSKKNKKADDGGAANKETDSKDPQQPSKFLSPRGSASDLKPQIARPVSIMNGIPPKAATFGLGQNRGVHSMAEVLLRFLESLREPVVPTEMYYRALEVANHQQAAYGLLDLMPPVNVNVFVYLTSFLKELVIMGSSGAGGHGVGEANSHTSGGNSGAASSAVGGAGGGGNTLSGRGMGGSSTGSIYGGNDTASLSGRGKKDDEDYRVSKLASVFSQVMLRPPPGAERLSEVEAMKRKMFLMQFLQEDSEEDGSVPPPPPPAAASSGHGLPGQWPGQGQSEAGAADHSS